MTLAEVWFFIWALLWALYFMTDGFDLGIGILLPVLAKNERDRRFLYNAAGPLWDGNEVWLLAAGGVTFAAFPRAYGVLFSAFHEALTLLVVALIVRGVSFEFRSKVSSRRARQVCDACQFLGSGSIAVLLGVAFANLFRGLAIVDGVRQGSFFSLLNPYALAGGILFLILFALHGALWLAMRTEGPLHARAAVAARVLWWLTLAAAVAFLAYSATATSLYVSYLRSPVLWIVPLVAVAALVAVRLFLGAGRFGYAWFASAGLIAAITLFGVIGMFPNLVPSTVDPGVNSISCVRSASSPLTLTIMLGVVATLVPVILVYQAWAYRMFSNKIGPSDLIY
jgi:cytochrome bd ubiquinol oxidase subunit II